MHGGEEKGISDWGLGIGESRGAFLIPNPQSLSLLTSCSTSPRGRCALPDRRGAPSGGPPCRRGRGGSRAWPAGPRRARCTTILAIRGEWRGNFRSTPSPCTMRRTVNVSRLPVPARAITTPVKIWMRSFSPSRMRQCTSTVSPISKCGTSSFRLDFSTRFRICWLIGSLPFVVVCLVLVVPGLLGRRLASSASRAAALASAGG